MKKQEKSIKGKQLTSSSGASVRPLIVHDFAIAIYSLATGTSRKESKRKIIEYLKEVERERIRLFGK